MKCPRKRVQVLRATSDKLELYGIILFFSSLYLVMSLNGLLLADFVGSLRQLPWLYWTLNFRGSCCGCLWFAWKIRKPYFIESPCSGRLWCNEYSIVHVTRCTLAVWCTVDKWCSCPVAIIDLTYFLRMYRMASWLFIPLLWYILYQYDSICIIYSFITVPYIHCVVGSCSNLRACSYFVWIWILLVSVR